MSAYLRIGSSGESDDNNDDPSASTLMIGSTCSHPTSENEHHPIDSCGGAGGSVTVSPSLSHFLQHLSQRI